MLTGIDKSDYSKIESGKRNLSFEQCRQLAVALETSMDLYGASAPPRSAGPGRGRTGMYQLLANRFRAR